MAELPKTVQACANDPEASHEALIAVAAAKLQSTLSISAQHNHPSTTCLNQAMIRLQEVMFWCGQARAIAEKANGIQVVKDARNDLGMNLDVTG